MTVLITGAAGFIGAALAERLLSAGKTVYGLDNFSDYYDVTLKQARINHLKQLGGERFQFRVIDLTEMSQLMAFVGEAQPTVILHMAAQASVRYALTNPQAYCHSNLVGHFNLLEVCRQCTSLEHLVYASTSSIYGNNDKVPFSEEDDVSRPQSLYAATKRADELITYSYGNMFGLKATAVRFFTVYGPWGRPDMSPMIFAKAIMTGEPIQLFNQGDLWRDFTYIDDIVTGVLALAEHVPTAEDGVQHAIYNIGNSSPVKIADFVTTLEEVLGKKAQVELADWPATEVYQTYADTSKLEAAVGWKPATDLKTGLTRFAEWFVPYMNGEIKVV